VADSLTVITPARISEMVLRRSMIRNEEGESEEGLPDLARTTPLAVFSE